MKLAIDGGPKAVANRLEIYGSRGSILADGTIGQNPAGRMIACLDEPGAACDAVQGRTADGGIAIDPPPVNTCRTEIEAFSAPDHDLTAREVPACPA